jgi:hypothetical protein
MKQPPGSESRLENCYLSQLYLRMPLSGGATPLNRQGSRRFDVRYCPRVRRLKTAQNFIRRILQPCVGLVKLTCCLARQLAELVAVRHMRKCRKYQIRTHYVISPSSLPACAELLGTASAAGSRAIAVFPGLYPRIRRTACASSTKSWHGFLCKDSSSCRIRVGDCRLGNPMRPAFPFPASINTHRGING